MAIYHNTIRSETKVIDGLEIGRYTYAYKESWSSGNYPGGRGRRVSLAEMHATNAAYKNRHVRHFIMADSFSEATQEGYYVFRVDREPAISCAEIKGEVVGRLRKEGNRFRFEAIV